MTKEDSKYSLPDKIKIQRAVSSGEKKKELMYQENQSTCSSYLTKDPQILDFSEYHYYSRNTLGGDPFCMLERKQHHEKRTP